VSQGSSVAPRICLLTRNALLIVDDIGYLPLSTTSANLFFQLINARHEQHAKLQAA